MTVVSCGCETWELQKDKEDILDNVQRNRLRIVSGTRLNDRTAKNKCYKQFSSIFMKKDHVQDQDSN